MSGVKHTYTVYCAQKLISEFILNSALSRARPAEPTYVCMYACFAVRADHKVYLHQCVETTTAAKQTNKK